MTYEKSLFTVDEEMPKNKEMFVIAEEEMEKEKSEDWRVSKEPKHFVIFLVKEMNRIPKPGEGRGNKTLLEKLLGQYKQLDSFISQAVRSDYDDAIDAKNVDEIRKVLNRYIDETQDALDGMYSMERQRRDMRKRRAEEENGEIVKEATTPPYHGVQTQMSLFESAIVRALINAVVSGGRQMEELFEEAKKKYDIKPREELAVLQALEDFGYPIFKDRMMVGDKNEDPTRKENFGEWTSQYYA